LAPPRQLAPFRLRIAQVIVRDIIDDAAESIKGRDVAPARAAHGDERESEIGFARARNFRQRHRWFSFLSITNPILLRDPPAFALPEENNPGSKEPAGN
jgi:hypothetical protein